MRWRLVPAEALAWRELGGEVVVLNARTGSTHLLEPPANEIFQTLLAAESGMSVPEIAARLQADGETPHEWYASVKAVLEEFERLGLAEAFSD